MLTKKEAVAILNTVGDGPAYGEVILRKLDEIDLMLQAARASAVVNTTAVDEDDVMYDDDIEDDEYLDEDEDYEDEDEDLDEDEVA